jgi:hypothetical protein
MLIFFEEAQLYIAGTNVFTLLKNVCKLVSRLIWMKC